MLLSKRQRSSLISMKAQESDGLVAVGVLDVPNCIQCDSW